MHLPALHPKFSAAPDRRSFAHRYRMCVTAGPELHLPLSAVHDCRSWARDVDQAQSRQPCTSPAAAGHARSSPSHPQSPATCGCQPCVTVSCICRCQMCTTVSCARLGVKQMHIVASQMKKTPGRGCASSNVMYQQTYESVIKSCTADSNHLPPPERRQACAVDSRTQSATRPMPVQPTARRAQLTTQCT